MKGRLLLVLCVVCFSIPVVGGYREYPPAQGSGVAHLGFCDLLNNPVKYDGQRVTVDAYYSYFFEVSWIFCWECRDKGRTWLEISEDADAKRVRQQLAKGS